MKKIGLIFGGISNEAGVSRKSAKNIIDNFDKTKYELIQIYRSKDNSFHIIQNIHNIEIKKTISTKDFKNYFDIAFLITHGKYGEDGVIQSILELEKIPYCGSRVLSSSLCMNKAVLKNFLSKHHINQVNFKTIDYNTDTIEEIKNKIITIKKQFSLPIYIKPANSGSSIGITKLIDRNELNNAIAEAKKHDTIIVIEEGLEDLREIEVAVIGNKSNQLNISKPGELIKDYDFYSFDEKYIINNMNMAIPAQISQTLLDEITKLTKTVYKLCDCKGFARIDFFFSKDKIYFNEINTLPGFTEISAFPILMINTGMTYTEIINKIISLAY